MIIFSILKQKNGFLKSVLTLTSGTLIAQAITIIASPVITRLYTPGDMGILASWLAITAILGSVATGCYDQAILLSEDESDVTSLALLSGIIAILMGLFVTFFLIPFRSQLIHLLKLNGISSIWFYCIGFVATLTGFDCILNRLLIRKKNFRVLASTQVIQQINTNGIKICTGIARAGSEGLFLATIISQIIRCVRLLLNEKSRFFSRKIIQIEEIKKNAIRYKKFPIFNTWAQFFNSASIQIPVILFAVLFSSDVVGYYSLSHRILSLPLSLIGGSVSSVFWERAAKSRNNEEDLRRITFDAYKKLLLIGTISMSFITFYGDMLFPFVFGGAWKEAGKYAQWVSIWIIFQFSASPISSIFPVLEKQGEDLFWNIVLFVSRISLLFISCFIKNIINIVGIYAMSSALVYFIFSLRVLVITKNKIAIIFLCLIKYCISIYIVQYVLYLFMVKYVL